MINKSEYETWASTIGLELEREVNGWMEKYQRVERERDELREQVSNCQANAHYQAWQQAQAENEQLREAIQGALAGKWILFWKVVKALNLTPRADRIGTTQTVHKGFTA